VASASPRRIPRRDARRLGGGGHRADELLAPRLGGERRGDDREPRPGPERRAELESRMRRHAIMGNSVLSNTCSYVKAKDPSAYERDAHAAARKHSTTYGSVSTPSRACCVEERVDPTEDRSALLLGQDRAVAPREHELAQRLRSTSCVCSNLARSTSP
jgi:hypothetical protein